MIISITETGCTKLTDYMRICYLFVNCSDIILPEQNK